MPSNRVPQLSVESIDPSKPPDTAELTRQILYSVQQIASIQSLNFAAIPRVISISNSPTLIIDYAKFPRSYYLINQVNSIQNNVISPVTAPFETFFASAARGVGAHTSLEVAPAGRLSLNLFLDITVSAGTMTIDLQSFDPLSGNFATVQSDIFAGASTVGTFYAFTENIGIGSSIRLLATVAGGAITFSVSGQFGISAGLDLTQTIFLGNASVTTTTGVPLFAGRDRSVFMKENSRLFGITSSAGITLKVFELQ